MMPRLLGPGLALLLSLDSAGLVAQEAPGWEAVSSILEARCIVCHSGSGAPLGLRLDSYEGARTGSENGPVLKAGDPDGSELVHRIRGESEPRMPLVGEPLERREIALIERWVREGLAGPNPPVQTAVAGASVPEKAEDAAPRTEDGRVTFERVEPIFLQRCAACHSDAAAKGPPEGLKLDSYANILKGGDRLALVPGRPEHSEIVRRIQGTARPRMPFNGPPWLSDEEIGLIRQWITDGAPSAEGTPAPVSAGGRIRLRGTLTGASAIDRAEFLVDADTRIDDRPTIGREAEMRGLVAEDASIRATRLRAR